MHFKLIRAILNNRRYAKGEKDTAIRNSFEIQENKSDI